MTAPAISLAQVRKDYGGFTALEEVSFDIAEGEFFTFLGPSGCGKTTLLRMIAGFEDTTEGTIHLYGEEIEDLPPHRRPVNTVFQNYALFPHMTVAENVAFGPRMLGWSKAQVDARTAEMIAMVRLGEFAHRRPSQLSGGQQQRVALARAMAPRPKVLLLDEPLSALDLKLRQEMRAELKALQRDTGITFIFVTHDQEEALSMSDRIAVMSAGRVQQIGAPAEIYEHPANRFVAGFVGETNLIEAEVVGEEADIVVCRLPGGEAIHAETARSVTIGETGLVSIRPEKLAVTAEEPAGEAIRGTLGARTYLGTDTQFEVMLSDWRRLRVRRQNVHAGEEMREGDPVFVSIAPGAARFLVD